MFLSVYSCVSLFFSSALELLLNLYSERGRALDHYKLLSVPADKFSSAHLELMKCLFDLMNQNLTYFK